MMEGSLMISACTFTEGWDGQSSACLSPLPPLYAVGKGILPPLPSSKQSRKKGKDADGMLPCWSRSPRTPIERMNTVDQSVPSTPVTVSIRMDPLHLAHSKLLDREFLTLCSRTEEKAVPS